MNSPSKIPSVFQTAVLFLIFNRPEVTASAFEAIRKAKPPRLYVAADGPRPDREGEAERVSKVRKIATAVDWPCEVKTLFREKNLGCKYGVSEAITWFFEQEEQGIILEDDNLAHPDFFLFCESLLNHYRNDERVLTISGDNFQNGQKRGCASYYFSKYFQGWGWATWRRTWKYYDENLIFWPEWKNSSDWVDQFPDKVERTYWKSIFDTMYAKQLDSMAYPFIASIMYRGGLNAIPNVNLVSNIGFGEDATHTTSTNNAHESNVPTHSLGELVHPQLVEINLEADIYDFNSTFGGRNLRFPRSWLLFPKRVLFFVFRKIIKFLK
jgi:hypothetical protein